MRIRSRFRAGRAYRRAVAAYWSGELDRAGSGFGTALEWWRGNAPESAQASRCLNWLGRVRQDQGDLTGAEDYFRAALRNETDRTAAPPRTPEAGDALNNLGRLCSDRSDYRAAAEWYQQALDVLTEAGSAQVATVLNNLGAIRLRLDDPDGALPLFQRALAGHAPDNHQGRSSALNNLAMIHHSRGEPATARRMLLESLEHCQLGRLPSAGASVLANLGHLDLEAGQPAEAIERYDSALRVFQTIAERSAAVADQHGNLCRALVTVGELDRALAHATAATDIYRAVAPESAGHARMVSETATVHHHRGDLTAALAGHREALRIHERVAAVSVAVAVDLNNIGREYQDLGDLPRALDYLRRALNTQEALAPETTTTAAMHNNVGTVLRALGQIEDGMAHCQRALAIDRSIAPRSAAYATDLSNIGTLLAVAGDREAALPYLVEALELDRQQATRSPAVAAALANLGAVRLLRGELSEAEELAREALSIDERLTPKSDRFANDLVLLADILNALGRPNEAVGHLRRAVELIEELRRRLGTTPNVRELVLADRYGAYHRLVAALVRGGGVGADVDDVRAESFQRAEQTKARVLADLLVDSGAVVTPATEEDRALINEERHLRWRLAAVDRESRESGRTAQVQDSDQTPPWLAERLRLEEALDEVGARLRTTVPAYRELRDPEPSTPNQVRALLRDDEIMIAYTVTVDGVFAWRITAAEMVVRELPVGQEKLAGLVDRATASYRTGVPGGEPETTAQRELGRVLLDPLALRPAAGSPRLIVIPDGRLSWLPFELLPLPDGSLLADRFVISYAPSATVLGQLRQRRPARADGPPSFVGFGHPTVSDPEKHAAPLPSMRAELHEIAKLFGDRATVHTDADATELAVREHVNDHRYIHFATHGQLDDAQPQFTGLVMAPPTEAEQARATDLDDVLQVHEIFELDVTAELVACSACDSGRGPVRAGEGVIGMSRAWLYAGADSVLLTLWPVPDRTTRHLMVEMYANLCKELSPAEALRAARQSLRQRRPLVYEDPRTWAAFVVIGNG